MALDQSQVLAALRTVRDPELHKDLVTLGMVKGVEVRDGVVRLHVDGSNASPRSRELLDRDIKAALGQIGATQVSVEMIGNPRGPGGGSVPAAGQQRQVLPQVKYVIAVGAGKGGVGKSTLAVNLAVGLQRSGASVGLMDG